MIRQTLADDRADHARGLLYARLGRKPAPTDSVWVHFGYLDGLAVENISERMRESANEGRKLH